MYKTFCVPEIPGHLTPPQHCHRATSCEKLKTKLHRSTPPQHCRRATSCEKLNLHAAPLLTCLETCSLPDTHSYAKYYWCSPPTINSSVSEEACVTFQHSSSLPTSNATSPRASTLHLSDSHVFPSSGACPPPVTRNRVPTIPTEAQTKARLPRPQASYRRPQNP
jgi:hypothetical protein